MKFTSLKVATAVFTLAMAATGAQADEQLRGGMTAVSNVASAMSQQSGKASFKWLEKAEKCGSIVNNAQRVSGSTFKWAERAKQQGELTASVDGKQAGTRWIMRNDADQSGTRWIMRNDADQSGTRWIMRNDADQSGTRWIMRNDADQSGTRWIMR